MIQLTDLQFCYQQQPLLDIAGWQVAAGERLLLTGASGSGKSTLLHLLAGLNQPDSGQLCIAGEELTRMSGRRKDRFRAQHMGFISQRLNLVPYLSALDNVLLAARLSAVTGSRKQLIKHATEQLLQVNLSPEIQRQKAGQLSIGQQQRVAIVRALIHEPALILADEPTSALDPHNRDVFMALLHQRCREQQTTLVMVSHDMSLAPEFSQTTALADINSVALQ